MTSLGELLTSSSRVAGPDEGIGMDELQLAGRNHSLPLEALRYDVTPAGLHYLLAGRHLRGDLASVRVSAAARLE